MSQPKIEGTIVLNGLIEGRLPDDPEIEATLGEWVRSMRQLGPNLNLEISASGFNLLPDNEPVACRALGDSPHEAISQALEQLVGLFPSEQRGRIASTLRSSEFRHGEEVQTLYMVRPDGTIRVEQQTVAAETTPPLLPLSWPARLRLAGLGLLLALTVLGVTSLLVDLPTLFGQLLGTVQGVQADEVVVDATRYSAFFTVKIKEIESGGVSLTLHRTDGFPTSDAALQTASEAAGDALAKRLAVDALARGYVRYEMFDSHGEFMGAAIVRIRELRRQAEIAVVLPLPGEKRRLGRIEFTY